jgi:hypothetical protein
VDIQFGGHVFFDGVEELAKLFGAMAMLCLSDDLAGPGVERSKQAGGAVRT